MSWQSKVFVLVLAGQQRDALTFARRRYPACNTVILSKTELRESGWKSQLRILGQLRGEALNTLLPMGMLVGEPVKASHVAPHLPFAAAFRALVVEFAFYCISLVLLLGSGMTAFIVAAHVSPSPLVIASVATPIVALAVLLPYLGRAARRGVGPAETVGDAGGRAATA